jgi:hypothetical protein
MNARNFLEQVVRQNLDEFRADFDSVRRAQNAVASVDALAAHIFHDCRSHFSRIKDDTEYRDYLARKDTAFRLLRDVAKANKHVRLDRGTPTVVSADQVSSRTIGYGEGDYGRGRYSAAQVIVDIAPGNFAYIETILDESVAFLETEMASLGL